MMVPAKACSRCHTEKPIEAFYAGYSRCKACRIEVAKECESTKRALAKWRAKNRDVLRAKRRAREQANPEHMRALDRKAYEKNPARYAKKRIDRRQSVKQATPAWSNTFLVEEAYRLARMRNAATGFKWHVDHIVPLKNESVCGLHAHTNIQVIPALVNHRKSNLLLAS